MASISQRLESLPMTRTSWIILLIIGIGWMFDAMDQGMVSGVLTAIGNDWGLSAYEKSWLMSSGTFGMILGAALSGNIADRWGRRKVITITLLLYSIGSALCGLCTEYWMLIVCRFITGFGLGGELPTASAYITEMSPARCRGRNVVLLESFWAWGWIAANLVAFLVIPPYGWRIAFFVGALPALFAAVLRYAVPESPRYLEIKGRHSEANDIVAKLEKEAGVKTVDAGPEDLAEKKMGWADSFRLLWSRGNLRSTAVLWVIWFGINFGYYGFVLWTPSLLVERGFDMVRSLGFTLIMCIAQLPGYFSAAYLVERVGRKPIMIVYFLGTALASWLFGHAGSEDAVLASGCLLYFFALGAWGCVYSYTPEVYPTDVRASGSGWASAFGRVGAFIAPFIVPALYGLYDKDVGFMMVFAVLTACFIAVAVVVAIFGRETKNSDLADISG
ncbi:MAG: MFS transporter [Candidatus Methanomethylophilaceae archaeon]|nr:MFS transporter [Candidatus Methanomethylophilaceae archaeon]